MTASYTSQLAKPPEHDFFKDFGRIANRHDKLAANFLSAIALPLLWTSGSEMLFFSC